MSRRNTPSKKPYVNYAEVNKRTLDAYDSSSEEEGEERDNPVPTGPHIAVGIPHRTTADADETLQWSLHEFPKVNPITHTAIVTLGTDRQCDIHIPYTPGYPALGEKTAAIELLQVVTKTEDDTPITIEYQANLYHDKCTQFLANAKLNTANDNVDGTFETAANNLLQSTSLGSRLYNGGALVLTRPALAAQNADTSPKAQPGIIIQIRGICSPDDDKDACARRFKDIYGQHKKALEDIKATIDERIASIDETFKKLNTKPERFFNAPHIGHFRATLTTLTKPLDFGNIQHNPDARGAEIIGIATGTFQGADGTIKGWLVQALDPGFRQKEFLIRPSDYANKAEQIGCVGDRVVFIPTPPPQLKQPDTESPRKKQRTDRKPFNGAVHTRLLPRIIFYNNKNIYTP